MGRGTKIKNLSPYLVLLQSIINQKKEVVENYLNNPESKKFKLILPKELDISSLSIQNFDNIVKL
ncbi:hypothetical protein GCM10023092_25490 [Rurimicrobium arvi]|uniref:Uncharacterized protein n=1 Tax=Rurimicrobium arvi TaxID=2049916 RepID=A0ABP8N281_9BACT